MKVVQNPPPKPAFQPVVITLESPEEAAYLWACLNLNPEKVESGNFSSFGSNPKPFGISLANAVRRPACWMPMFDALDKIARA